MWIKIKDVRINFKHMVSYHLEQDTIICIYYVDGNYCNFKYDTKEEAQLVLEMLDNLAISF